MLSKRKIMTTAFVMAALGATFSWGVLVAEFQVFPYNQAKTVWSWIRGAGLVEESGPKGVLRTNLLSFDITTKRFADPKSGCCASAGLSRIGNDIIGVDGIGNFFLLRQGIDILPLDIELTTNRNQFVDDTNRLIEADGRRELVQRYFRLMDLVYYQRDGDEYIVVSYHYWNPTNQTRHTRVSRLVVNGLRTDPTSFTAANTLWEPLYESSYPFTLDDPLSSNRTGGALAVEEDGTILVSIGENSVLEGMSDPREEGRDLGTIIRIDPASGSADLFANGVRNPQGIFIDTDGVIWETEHGPKGGDELNILEEGTDYGWPFVTYGTDYGSYEWHFDEAGTHSTYRRPVYAWVPSIGVSNLIGIKEKPQEWSGDLLVSSLRAKSLFRLRVRESRVILAETIHIGERILDVDQFSDGTIVFITHTGFITELKPKSGSALPETVTNLLTSQDIEIGLDNVLGQCQSCHSLDNQIEGYAAPPLLGVLGREIASVSGYDYSRALRDAEGTWTSESLRTYLTTPQDFAPGTTMPQAQIESQQQMDALIDFLTSFSDLDVQATN